MAKRRNKGDLTYPVPEWWLQKLEEWMDEKRVNQTQLAKLVGSTQSNISRLRAGEYEESADVASICRATGLPLPSIEADAAMQELVKVLQDIEQMRPGTVRDETRHLLQRLSEIQRQPK